MTIYVIEEFLLTSRQKDISMGKCLEGGITTFITCQAINLWESQVMVELFFHENQN